MTPIAPEFGTCITVVATSAARSAARSAIRVAHVAAPAIGGEGGVL